MCVCVWGGAVVMFLYAELYVSLFCLQRWKGDGSDGPIVMGWDGPNIRGAFLFDGVLKGRRMPKPVGVYVCKIHMILCRRPHAFDERSQEYRSVVGLCQSAIACFAAIAVIIMIMPITSP